MKTVEIEEKIFKLVRDGLDLDGDSVVTVESNLRDDLGADSLDEIELIIEAEECFDIEVNEDSLSGCKTIKDIVTLVEDSL